MFPPSTVLAALVALSNVWAAPTYRRGAPTVTLDNGNFFGVRSGQVDMFLGIPFAQPPIGDLRLRLPVANSPYNGNYEATKFGLACHQQTITVPLVSGLPAEVIDYITNIISETVLPSAEDCLILNVWAPASATPASKLPVVAWIFGGGFQIGSSSLYDGASIVNRSIEMKTPVIYVSMNYRLSGLGFLASEEVKAAGVGNLGLQDQRSSFRWIRKYIGQFGGDPAKVTIWGESAGATSVALHMLTNGGNNEGLFRGAFMQSGGPIQVGDISHGQKYYDDIVSKVGCSTASDRLGCLRTVSYGVLIAAIDDSPTMFSYQSLNLAWIPRVDGIFLTQPPFDLVAAGSVANVPFVTGNCDDEGTLFSVSQLNVTTDTAFDTYIRQIYMPNATDAVIAQIAAAYPSDVTNGSPFNTGKDNALTPQFKRLAAVQGDLIFQAPRRFFLQQRAGAQKAWSFLYKRNKLLPYLGAAHGSDVGNIYGTGELRDYLISFTVSQDPNGAKISPRWPAWTPSRPRSLEMNDGLVRDRVVVADTYRNSSINLLIDVFKRYPL